MAKNKFRITEKDFILANRKASREEEIAQYGKQVLFRTTKQKSKKVYDRKRLKIRLEAYLALFTCIGGVLFNLHVKERLCTPIGVYAAHDSVHQNQNVDALVTRRTENPVLAVEYQLTSMEALSNVMSYIRSSSLRVEDE